MKNTKKIVSLLLSILMIITALPLTAVNSFAATSGDYEYSVLDDGTAEIKRYTGSATELEIPSVIDGYIVTSIGHYAFTSLERVIIPYSITSILYYAFSECPSLREINVNSENISFSSEDGVLFNKGKTQIVRYPRGKADSSYSIPDSITSIGYGAFIGCSSLTNVIIPNSVTSISYGAFIGCSSLTSVIIPNSVTSIGHDAFYNCTSLASINIPDSVTSIESSAFGNCISLISITIPDSVISIDYTAFYNTLSHRLKE